MSSVVEPDARALCPGRLSSRPRHRLAAAAGLSSAFITRSTSCTLVSPASTCASAGFLEVLAALLAERRLELVDRPARLDHRADVVVDQEHLEHADAALELQLLAELADDRVALVVAHRLGAGLVQLADLVRVHVELAERASGRACSRPCTRAHRRRITRPVMTMRRSCIASRSSPISFRHVASASNVLPARRPTYTALPRPRELRQLDRRLRVLHAADHDDVGLLADHPARPPSLPRPARACDGILFCVMPSRSAAWSRSIVWMC